jgi:hypothetical protein
MSICTPFREISTLEVMIANSDALVRFGIGHKATCDWDDILRQDRGRPVEDEDSDAIMNDEENVGGAQEAGDLDVNAQENVGEPIEPADEWEEIAEWEGVMEGGEGDENDEAEDDANAWDADGSDEDHVDDRVVADEGEELDEMMIFTLARDMVPFEIHEILNYMSATEYVLTRVA